MDLGCRATELALALLSRVHANTAKLPGAEDKWRSLILAEFEEVLREKDLQLDEARKARESDKTAEFWQERAVLAEEELEDTKRLYDECLKIAESRQSYSPQPNPSDMDRGWKACARDIAESIRQLKQTEKRKGVCDHCDMGEDGQHKPDCCRRFKVHTCYRYK